MAFAIVVILTKSKTHDSKIFLNKFVLKDFFKEEHLEFI